MERIAIHYINADKEQQVFYVQMESMIFSILKYLNPITVLMINKETLSCVKETNMNEKYKTLMNDDTFYTPTGKALELMIWALNLYQPNIYMINKLKNEHVLFTKETSDKNTAFVKLVFIDLYRKRLTMKELDYLHNNIILLPQWLQPYK